MRCLASLPIILGEVTSKAMPALFDPLRYLTHALHARLILREKSISIRHEGRVAEHQRQEAVTLVREHIDLLRLQLENGGASVQKLLAKGIYKVQKRNRVPVKSKWVNTTRDLFGVLLWKSSGRTSNRADCSCFTWAIYCVALIFIAQIDGKCVMI